MSAPINEADTIHNLVDLMKKIDGSQSDAQAMIDYIRNMGQFRVSVSILKSTKAGKKMTKWSSNKNSEVGQAAKSVLESWKKQINEEKSKAKKVDNPEAKPEKAPEPAPVTENVPKDPPATPPLEAQTPPAAPARVRQADVEYEEEKKLENVEDYDTFIRDNETEDSIRNNVRKGNKPTF